MSNSISEAFRDWLNQPVIAHIKHMEAIMAELDDKIAAINAAVAQLKTDLTAAIADLKSKIGTPVTPEQLAALDAIATSLGALDTQAKAE